MRVLVNGRTGALDPSDRGLQYGDGLFETIAVRQGRPRFLERHLERLVRGARRLALALPDLDVLRSEIADSCPDGRGVIKVIVTRGIGERGYRPPVDAKPTRIVMSGPWPDWPAAAWTDGVRVAWCGTRIGRNPALAGIKHLNRLEQVLARAEWDDAEMDEGLMQDDRGYAICATQANVFARVDGRWVTPLLDQCGVAGVMRSVFQAWTAEQGMPVIERDLPVPELARATALALTNALIGAWPVRTLTAQVLAPDPAIARFNAWLDGQ